MFLEGPKAQAHVLSNIMYYCNDKVSYINHFILHKHNHPSDGIKAGAYQHSSLSEWPRKQGRETTATVVGNLRRPKAGDVNPNVSQRWSDIEIQVDRIALDRIFIVGQMLTIFDTRVAHNLKRQHSIVVLVLNQAQDSELIDVTLQGEHVVAGLEVKVWNECVANCGAVDG